MMSPAGLAAAAGQAPSKPKERMTHVEIGRVQNGFIVKAMSYERAEAGVKAIFIAKDETELTSIISSILISEQLDWLPTMDIPMLFVRQDMERLAAEKRALEAQLSSTQSPPFMTPPHIGSPIYGHGQAIGVAPNMAHANVAQGFNPP